MEQQNDIAQFLNVMAYPAFCVKDGSVTHCNQEALRLGISIGDSINNLLATGTQEYADFQDGCLNLTLNISGIVCNACVSRWNHLDVFVIDQDPDQMQLQAMALAAQELRGPLSNIMSVADELFPMAENTHDPSAGELASRINRSLFQMLRTIGNMSDAYRYSKENRPQLELRDVRAIWDEFFTGSAQLISHTGIQLNYTGLRDSVYCLVDSEKLERAANNILANAVKFSEKGSAIDVKLAQRGDMLYLTVQDSGSGIPQQLRSSIFSRFQRQPGIEDGRFGIGLGMVLIRSAAAIHGGTVLIEQLSPKGTRITMTIKIRQSTDSAVRTPAFRVDYAGEQDHRLIELSESLPVSLYTK